MPSYQCFPPSRRRVEARRGRSRAGSRSRPLTMFSVVRRVDVDAGLVLREAAVVLCSTRVSSPLLEPLLDLVLDPPVERLRASVFMPACGHSVMVVPSSASLELVDARDGPAGAGLLREVFGHPARLGRLGRLLRVRATSSQTSAAAAQIAISSPCSPFYHREIPRTLRERRDYMTPDWAAWLQTLRELGYRLLESR